MRLGSFTYLLKQGAKNTYLNKAMSIASVGVLTACLVIVGFSMLLSENIKSIIGYVQQQNEIIVYVDPSLSADGQSLLDKQIRSLDNISSVEYTSKEEAFENQHEKLGELLDGYENEDIFPASYHLKMKDISLIEENVETISRLEGIYKVDAPTDVAEVMVKTEQTVTVAGSVVVIALLVVSLVIIMNTIKITVFNRRREINIMKYVGATNGFIRMPFLVEGMILGAVAATVSFLFVWYLYTQIYNGVANDMTSWLSSAVASLIPFKAIAWKLVLAYLATGIIIGGFGSLISTRKHLKV
jgi:cell division transport system permease protein